MGVPPMFVPRGSRPCLDPLSLKIIASKGKMPLGRNMGGTPMPRLMIRLTHVSKSYDGGTTKAVDDLSLDVADGELLALVGTSGCGKTTTLKMINRLIEPTAGAIKLDGRDISQGDPVELRRGIGYVFQGVGLFPHRSVAENVATVPKLLKWDKAKTRRRVDELLSLVHLPPADFRDRRPSELSGGQRQRVGFARALAAEPRVMLLDEPFGALDPVTRDALQAEFKQIQRQLNLTAVLVTHDMAEALLLADRIAVMDAGRLLRVDTPANLVRDPGGGYVERLLATPRNQAERLASLSNGVAA